MFHLGASVDEHLLLPELLDHRVGILVERIVELPDLFAWNRAGSRWRIDEHQRLDACGMCGSVLAGDRGAHAVTHEHKAVELLGVGDVPISFASSL